MFTIAPVTLQFTSVPEIPKSTDYPVLAVEKASGKMGESWKIWSKIGRTYAQLTDKSVIEIVGWASIKGPVQYECPDETNFDIAEEIKDYVTFDQIPARKQMG
jgi:hypothetical protein